MVLAAGFGTRLYPLTSDRTKPAVPFLGRPLIEYSLRWLCNHGIRDIAINLHHSPGSIKATLGDGAALGVRIHYSFEQEILGTGGALDRLRDYFSGETFVVMNGKVVTEISLGRALEFHRERRSLATLVLAPNTDRGKFSVVGLGPEDHVLGFDPASEESLSAATQTPLLFTGIQILDPRIFEFIPVGRLSHTTVDVYPDAIARGERVLGYVTGEPWYELSTLERYLDTSLLLMRREGRSVDAGAQTVISEHASVSNSVLWNGVRIEAGASVTRAIMGDDVVIREGTVIENAAVVRADRVPHIERGTVVGDNLVVSLT